MPETHVKPGPSLDEDRDKPPVLPPGPDLLPGYAELHCISNFSFLRGASHPQELVRRAYDLGYQALALTDECSVAGVVRAHTALREYLEFARRLEEEQPQHRRERPFQLLFGSEFDLGDARLVAIARDLEGWGGLCEFISIARMQSPKGEYDVDWDRSNFALLSGCEVLFAPRRDPGAPLAIDTLCARLAQAKGWFGDSLWLAVELPQLQDDDLWLASLREAGERCGVPLVAAGDAHMHARSRKRLQDLLTAVRLGRTVADCGFALQGNAERHLRLRVRLGEIFPHDLLAATLDVARRCSFDLASIGYNYPRETLPPDLTPTQALRVLVHEGARRRYPQCVPLKVRLLLRKELALIAECKYEMFFLTVHDIVRFAEERKILCQGRGSAANSVVCFCLGITAMDPMHSQPLLERFISKDRRNEPPDIDVDFEHERREEVIQYIYGKYGRERAAIAAVVISYRTRSAIRDTGKALGIPDALVDAFAKDHHWFDDKLDVTRLRDLARITGCELGEHEATLWMEMCWQLMGFPRHLSQHVGGFVLTETRLVRLVPVENASMKDRSVIQWDKDDLEDMGLMKVDVLALGMLTALRRCLDLRNALRGTQWALRDIPDEDPATYEMIRRADTVGVFQIESRAQMSMLPRLKPRTFYDLVVEVAIVRPGPISGGMVHPYLRARERRDRGLAITYERSSRERGAKPRLQKALERTLGVPIFQEQVMEISMIAAGFTATQADSLRRAMAAWTRKGKVNTFHQQLVDGMLANGYTLEFAERIFKQIEGFGEYGFPESHAYSFALLAYKSSWLKCHEPECFLAAMLNSQPMGFYAPAQLVQDAQRHGVVVLPVDVSHSDWDAKLESCPVLGSDSNSPPRVRLGLRQVAGLGEAGGRSIVEARLLGPFRSVEELVRRAGLGVKDINALAAGDALVSLAGHRRQQVWEASAQRRAPALLENAPITEDPLDLPPSPEGEEILFDYDALGLTLRRHPLALLRDRLQRRQVLTAAQLDALPHGRHVLACGIVTVRQRPGTAKGTMFVTMEDETGPINVIVWPAVLEDQRDALLRARLLAVEGTWQRDTKTGGLVRHLVAEKATDLTRLLGRLGGRNASRDFH